MSRERGGGLRGGRELVGVRGAGWDLELRWPWGGGMWCTVLGCQVRDVEGGGVVQEAQELHRPPAPVTEVNGLVERG